LTWEIPVKRRYEMFMNVLSTKVMKSVAVLAMLLLVLVGF
jgi:hypothetical protein